MSSNPVVRQASCHADAQAMRASMKRWQQRSRPPTRTIVLYQIEAFLRLRPGPGLEKIRAPLLAINSADDLINPPELGILEREIKRVAQGRAVVIPLSPDTRGHGTHTIATMWKAYLQELLSLSAR